MPGPQAALTSPGSCATALDAENVRKHGMSFTEVERAFLLKEEAVMVTLKSRL